jgi:hypothetical protein
MRLEAIMVGLVGQTASVDALRKLVLRKRHEALNRSYNLRTLHARGLTQCRLLKRLPARSPDCSSLI